MATYGVKTFGKAYDRAHLSFFDALAFAVSEATTGSAAAVYHVPTDTLVLSVGIRDDGESVICDADGERLVDLRAFSVRS